MRDLYVRFMILCLGVLTSPLAASFSDFDNGDGPPAEFNLLREPAILPDQGTHGNFFRTTSSPDVTAREAQSLSRLLVKAKEHADASAVANLELPNPSRSETPEFGDEDDPQVPATNMLKQTHQNGFGDKNCQQFSAMAITTAGASLILYQLYAWGFF